MTDDNGVSHSYDGAGNRTNVGYAHTSGNRIVTDGTWTYTFDNEGNMTKKSKGVNDTTYTYGYDHRNEMIWAEERATGGALQMRADYKYDVNANRIQKLVDEDGDTNVDINQRYALDGWKPGGNFKGNENWDVWADLDGTNAVDTRYLRGDVIDQLFAQVDATDTNWLLGDHLGTIRNVTDGAGANKNTITYSAFGEITNESDPNFSSRYTYTGRERDVETNLQYHHERYYSPEIGRWTSEDPLGFRAGDSNLFRYVTNQPTTQTDPSGLQHDGQGVIFLPKHGGYKGKLSPEWNKKVEYVGRHQGIRYKSHEINTPWGTTAKVPKRTFSLNDPFQRFEAIAYEKALRRELSKYRDPFSQYLAQLEFYNRPFEPPRPKRGWYYSARPFGGMNFGDSSLPGPVQDVVDGFEETGKDAVMTVWDALQLVGSLFTIYRHEWGFDPDGKNVFIPSTVQESANKGHKARFARPGRVNVPPAWSSGMFNYADETNQTGEYESYAMNALFMGIPQTVVTIETAAKSGDWQPVRKMGGGLLWIPLTKGAAKYVGRPVVGAITKRVGNVVYRFRPATGTVPEFGPHTLGAAEAPRRIPGYGWTDRAYWRLVRELQAGESRTVPTLRIAAELRRDAFPELIRSRYRGPLSQAPDLRGTYDWHNPQRMIHPGPHQTPHIQIKLQDGTVLRIEVAQ